jgi:hypothetical protein
MLVAACGLSLQVLRLVFSCLKNAPASDTWDLSSLLVNGSPVSQATVIAVLEVLYSNMWALGFEAERKDGQYSLQALLDMLLFADAVGCSRQALNQLAGMLGSTVTAALELTLPAAAASSSNASAAGATDQAAAGGAASSSTLLLQLDGWFRLVNHLTLEDPPRTRLQRHTASGTFSNVTEHPFDLQQQAEQLKQQVSQQLEALLFVGFKLDLQQLLQPALRFLRVNADTLQLLPQTGDGTAAIMSQRVLAAAGGVKGSELLSRALLQQQLGKGFGVGSVFADVKYTSTGVSTQEQRQQVSFEATLMQQWGCFEKGAKVYVTFKSSGIMSVSDTNAVHWVKCVCSPPFRCCAGTQMHFIRLMLCSSCSCGVGLSSAASSWAAECAVANIAMCWQQLQVQEAVTKCVGPVWRHLQLHVSAFLVTHIGPPKQAGPACLMYCSSCSCCVQVVKSQLAVALAWLPAVPLQCVCEVQVTSVEHAAH